MTQKETFPPTTPYKEKYRTRIRTVSGSGERAREEPTGSDSGPVDLRQTNLSSGSALINHDFIFDERYDPVQIALVALQIPRSITWCGKTYNYPRIMRWYLRYIDETLFRQLAYKQWRENTIDGEPRSRAATFMAKLWKAWKGGEA